MFEKEIKFISDFSLNKIKKLGAFFTFDKLLNADLHPAIIQYVSAEIDFLIYEDRKKLLQSSVFDYSGPEVARYFNAIANEIKKNKRVSFEDIKKLVIQAVSFNINYTARPKWSLTRLVYDSKDTMQVEDIKMMLSYLYYYDYLRTILLEYFSKKKINSLSSIEFEVLLNKIDKNLFAAQSEVIVDNVINSIADFHNLGGVNKSRVSLTAVEAFLKEKNMIDHIFKIKKAYPQELKQNVEAGEIKNIINSTIIISQEAEPEESEEVPIDEDEIKKEDEIEKEDEKVDDGDQPAEDNTLLMEYEDESADLSEKELLKFDVEKEEELSEMEDEENVDDLLLLDEETENKDAGESPSVNEPAEEEEIDLDESEDLLSFYDEQLKSFEENETPEIGSDDEEVKFDISEKKNLDSLYDFEEESDSHDLSEDIEEELNESDEFQLEKEEEVIGDENEINSEEAAINEDEIDSVLENLDEKEDLYKAIESDDLESEIEVDSADKEDITAGKRNKDIFGFLTNKDMDKIVGNIFNEDREDFANTMEKISECDSYDEATEILKGVFFTYKVNPYSRDAVTLTNAVSNYFDQA